MSRSRTLCVLALAMLALASPAQAAVNETPASDPRASGLVGAALEHWRSRGIQTCPSGIQVVYADLELMAGLSYLNSCWAALDREWTFGYVRNPISRRWHRRLAALECKAWTHEIGHALGVDHQPGHPVMDEWALMEWRHAPAECWRIARMMVPVKHWERSGSEPSRTGGRSGRR